MILLLLSLTAGWSLSFPFDNSGYLHTRLFFQPDTARFIHSEIDDQVSLVEYGPLRLGVGLSVETYIGSRESDSDPAINVRGGRWHIRGVLDVDYKNLLITLLADHNSYQGAHSEDSSLILVSGLNIGVENRIAVRFEDHAVPLPAGYIPHYKVSLGLYHPRGESFQTGHLFDWSMHAALDIPLLSAHRIIYGFIWDADHYFHRGGGSSGRQFLEVYGSHQTGLGDLVLFLRHCLHDDQPVRPLNGETCLGLRFSW